MKTIFIVAFLVLLAVCAIAADKPIVGTWSVTSDSPDGEKYTWTMVVTEQDGKLAGKLTGGPGEFVLLEPKLDGDTFTFQIQIDEAKYGVTLKVSGASIDGTWKGPGSQGAIKGSKQA